MNARTLTTGLALTATMLFGTAAMATNADNSGVGDRQDIRPGFKYDTVTYDPTSPRAPGVGSNLAAGQIIYDRGHGDELGGGNSTSLARMMAAHYVPVLYRLFSAIN